AGPVRRQPPAVPAQLRERHRRGRAVAGRGRRTQRGPARELMGIVRRTAAVVVPLTLVVGGVWYGIARHDRSSKDDSVGLCTTKVNGLKVVLTATQARNASVISAIAVHRGMPAHAATIALAAALQESKLYN